MTESSYPNVHKNFLLEKRADELNLGVIPVNDWIKMNKNTIDLYRTNYSPELLARCVNLIKEQKLHPTDRLGLQSDVFALVGYELNKLLGHYFPILPKSKMPFFQKLSLFSYFKKVTHN